MPATLRTPSATPGCPVTVSGQNVTFAGWDLDWELYSDIVLDTWYVYNFTRSAGLVIHAKSGTEGGGYTLTVTGDASAWVTGDTCLVLQGAFSAITTHATIAATITAMSANDTVELGYVVSNRTKWQETLAMGVKPVNVYGHLSRQRCSLNGAVTIVGDQTSNTTQVVWRNFTTFPGTSNGCHYQDTGGTLAGGGVKWRRIVVISANNAPGYGFYNQASGTNVCRGEFCVAINNASGFRHVVPTLWYHCVAFWSTGSGFYNNNVAGTHQNCVAFACGTDFATTTNGSYTKCASSDTTGSEAGLRSLTMAQCSFWRTASNFFNLDMRITTASTLYNAGTAVAGLTTDIDGTTIGAGTCPIGYHSGTVNAYGVTWPTASNVVAGTGTYDSFSGAQTPSSDKLYSAADEVSRNVDPGITHVEAPTAYKIHNAALVGTLSLSLTNPSAPDITVARLSDTSCRVTIDGDAGVTNYVVYSTWTDKGNTWTAGGNRSGDGTVDITGLTSGQTYLIECYSQHSSGGRSAPSNVLVYTAGPASGAVGTYATLYAAVYNTIRTSAALASKVTTGTPANHVKQGRYINTATGTTDHEDLIANGPIHYVLPDNQDWAPGSMDSARGELRIRVKVVEQIDQSASADLVTPINYVDALRQELLNLSDGTGGASSWTAGGRVRISVDGPHDAVKLNEVETMLTITVAVPEAI